MCVLLPKVKQSAFTRACLTSTSARVVYKWLWWDLTGSHPAGSSLVILVVDLASFCDNQSTRRPQLGPFGSVKFLNRRNPPLRGWPTTPHPPPIDVLVVLTRPENKLSKVAGNSTSYPLKSGYTE